jgi:iron complex outermembrane recepter protein
MRVRWTPTDRLTVDLKGEYAQLKTNGRPVFLRRFDNNAQFVGLANAFRELFGPPGLPPYGFTNADITPSFTPGDQEISGFGDPDFSDIDTTVLQATIAYDLTDDLTVKSITSFTKTNSLIQVDFDATPVDFLSVGYTEDNEAFTQELQVFGSAADGRLNYTLGGFYFKNDFSRIQALEIGFLPPDTSGGNQVYDVESFAVYGQLSYDLTDQLTAAVGLRYTDESINAGLSGAFLAPPGQPIIPQTFPESNVSFTDWSPYFGINFQASDDVFLFAKASKGFRAGGFTINKLFLTDAQAGNQLATPFRPETAWTYELGARIEAFDGRLRFNPTIFQTNWDSLQFLQPGSNVPNIFTNNAGDARIRGLELETQFAVTDQLVLSGSFSYLDARYTRLDQNLRTLFPDGFVTNTNGLGPIPSFFAGGPPVVPNVTGPRMGAPVVRNYVDINTPLPRAPEFKYTIGARYTVPLNSGAEVVINADYAWTDKQTTTAESIAQFVPSYGLLNGRVQYTSADGMWSVGVFGNNLTNDFYINNETSYDLGLTVGPRLVDPGRGRSYGIEFGFNF